ncbi:MAG TPA: hypothetical protein V6D19_15845 [Stenomitos sp.]
MAIGITAVGIGRAERVIRPFRPYAQKPVGRHPSALLPRRKLAPVAAQSKSASVRRYSSLPGVSLNPAQKLAPLSPDRLGFNLHVASDVTRPGLIQLMRNARAGIVRWPGGTQSDVYHWRTHTMCGGWNPHPNSTFDQFMGSFVQPGRFNVAVTLNYGTNESCTGGGDPAEAAAWVAYAKAKGYRVKYWTVGNEVFGPWETDLHAQPHDPKTYAQEVAQGYYPQIKAVDPKAKVGIVVNPYDLWDATGWTRTVLQKTPYDFVETHYYPLLDEATRDSDLLFNGVPDFRAQILALRQAMGSRKREIMLGEFNNVPTRPNRQTMSVVNALYTGMLLAESAELNVSAAFPWELQEDYCSHDPAKGLLPTANFKSDLYGWQTFATYSAFSIGFPSASETCSKGLPTLPFGTPFPVARTARLFGQFVNARGSMVATEVSPEFPLIRAYGASRGSGFGLLLFNLDSAQSVTLPVNLMGESVQRTVQIWTYGKQQYDQSRFNRWVGPAKQTLGTLSPTFQVELPPWSMSFVQVGL